MLKVMGWALSGEECLPSKPWIPSQQHMSMSVIPAPPNKEVEGSEVLKQEKLSWESGVLFSDRDKDPCPSYSGEALDFILSTKAVTPRLSGNLYFQLLERLK